MHLCEKISYIQQRLPSKNKILCMWRHCYPGREKRGWKVWQSHAEFNYLSNDINMPGFNGPYRHNRYPSPPSLSPKHMFFRHSVRSSSQRSKLVVLVDKFHDFKTFLKVTVSSNCYKTNFIFELFTSALIDLEMQTNSEKSFSRKKSNE